MMRLGPSFELTSHLILPVRAGIGIGLVSRILVADEMTNAELISLDQPFANKRGYYLACPPRNEMLNAAVSHRVSYLVAGTV
jgi:LysR family glycine cleavage system transcriptional activator